MSDEFLLQLSGTKLLFTRMHYGRLSFALYRLVLALYFLVRVPYWLLHGILRLGKEKRAKHPVRTYLLGSWYCLVNWKRLFMNPEAIERRFSAGS